MSSLWGSFKLLYKLGVTAVGSADESVQRRMKITDSFE